MTHLGVVQILLNLFGLVVTTWWIWLPMGLTLGFLAWQNYRRTKFAMKTDYQLLSFVLPEHPRHSAEAADALFASLHGILRPRKEIFKDGAIQEHISFEVAVLSQQTFYFLWAPKHLLQFIESQVTAHYPEARLVEVANDYANREFPQSYGHTATLRLRKPDVLPVKTYRFMESDSLQSVQTVLAGLHSIEEEYWMQVLIRPVDDSWHKRSAKAIMKLRDNKSLTLHPASLAQQIVNTVKTVVRPPRATKRLSLSSTQLAKIAAIEEKGAKPGFETKIRLAYLGNNQDTAQQRLDGLAAAFTPFTRDDGNAFKATGQSFDTANILEYRARYFAGKGYLLNTEELASIWHLPTNPDPEQLAATTNATYDSLPTLDNTAEESLSLIGSVDGNQGPIRFGLRRDDRAQPVLIAGESGSGKTSLLTLMTLSDIYHHQGVCLFDPDGSYSQTVLSHIPAERAAQTVYFNLSDTHRVPVFNPLQIEDREHIPTIVNILTEALKTTCDLSDARSEYLIRYSLQALIDYPPGTLLDIEPLLTSAAFRDEVITHILDPVVRNFWVAEFGSWDQAFTAESIAEVIEGLQGVLSDPQLAAIVGQAKSRIYIPDILQQGGILLVNGAGTLTGPGHFNLLAQALLAHIAASSQTPSNHSTARPIYVYLDKAEHYLLPSLSFLLEESTLPTRLTLSISSFRQIPQNLRHVIFSTAQAKILFRLPWDDMLYSEIGTSMENDIVDLPNRHFLLMSSAHTVKDAKTLTVPPSPEDLSSLIIEQSHQKFTISHSESLQLFERRRTALSELKANIDTSLPRQGNAAPSNRVEPPTQPSEEPAATGGGMLQENEVIHIR